MEISPILEKFKSVSNEEIALQQKAYMKNLFSFFGVKSPQRKEIQKFYFKKENLPSKEEAKKLVSELWKQPERECQYFAQEYYLKFKKDFSEDDILFFEELVLTKSWWDTVDFIAANLVGSYFLKFPEKRKEITSKWLASENIWLKRTAILFQLKYREKTDTELLENAIHLSNGTKEFFLNKAIGWALRNYSKTNPIWVKEFIEKTELSNLSVKEGSKYL
ncbi:DNA alkylation repair protein [Aureivirga sp. CE67]|uniref:DNA alkylation repair protein n=1 Tax=Aureivirga sp. CE67 TaxID=1788983 RepID=UPI0018CA5FB4|nr:DNA alkylation repair protein [Aureivirga sp. CE67]